MEIGEKIETMLISRGMSKTFVSKGLGITSKSLYNKLDGRTQFTVLEIQKLGILLRLSSEEIGDLILSSK